MKAVLECLMLCEGIFVGFFSPLHSTDLKALTQGISVTTPASLFGTVLNGHNLDYVLESHLLPGWDLSLSHPSSPLWLLSIKLLLWEE